MEHYSHDGLTFPVTDSGPVNAEADHTVVLLHGFPETRASWQDVSSLLNERGHRTLAPDLRGLPASARPRGRRAYRVERLVEDVVALLDEAELPSAHLVGHDWGGGIAWEVALRHPRRVRTLTVLATPHPSALAWSMVRSTQALRSWYMLAMQLPRLPEAALARGLERDGLRSLHLPERYRTAFEEQLQRPHAPGSMSALSGAIAPYRALFLWPPSPTTRPRSTVSAPTTYLWGRRDPYLGAAAAHRTARHCTGPYRFIEADADHWLPENHPDLVAEAILDRLRG